MKILVQRTSQKEVLTNSVSLLLDDKKAHAVFSVLLASCFIGLCAQIKIPLYFTPVPLTGQTVGVILMGAVLGRKKGLAAALLYLAQGSIGLPVWAGGAGGFHQIFGPTGGYLLAYPLQAYLIGSLSEKKHVLSFVKITTGFVFSCFLQLALGSLWLSFFVGMKNMLLMGFYPFIPGEVMKAFLITWFIKSRQSAISQ